MILAALNQTPVILQVFALSPDGSEKLDVASGTVRVYTVSGAVESDVLATTALVQVGVSNVWRYEWVPAALPVGQYVVEYVLTDDDAIMAKVGDDLVVRDVAAQSTLAAVQSTLSLVQADLVIVKKVETGRWKIDNNQMVFYDTDGTTPLLTFDLFDDVGLPSEDRVFERKLA